MLGLLKGEPLHGYEVKNRFEAMLGGTWEVNIGQIYTTLQRLERGGRSLLTSGGVQPAHLQALIAIATKAGRLEVQKVDGVPVMDSPLKAALREAGFSQTHRSLIAYGARG